MIRTKPTETYRNLRKKVSLNGWSKTDRNLRNHFLKEGGEQVSPLARHLAPLAPQQRYALAGFACWALTTRDLL